MGKYDDGSSGFDGGDYYGSESEFSLSAILGPLLGALAGAVTWAILARFFRIELGWVAWAIGGLVGLGARVGNTPASIESGLLCALLALVTIGVGKVGAIKATPPTAVRDAVYERLQPKDHDKAMADARSYTALDRKNDEAVRNWMFAHGHTKAESPEAITDEQLEAFRSETGARLVRWATAKPRFTEWRLEVADLAGEAAASVTLKEALRNSLTPFDLFFFALGILTAFVLGGRLKA